VLGQAFFFAVASLMNQAIVVYDKAVLDASDRTAGLPLAFFGVGVGGGALLASRLSGRKVEYGLIPLGAAGIALFTTLFAALSPHLVGTRCSWRASA
jgi:acyl-[acyl-carrier-protein]-phospholipid O-acyltransferase/long-chain-fatty-acid--[acyl-carrier-protein] ligase